jgi:hypothetical protein
MPVRAAAGTGNTAKEYVHRRRHLGGRARQPLTTCRASGFYSATPDRRASCRAEPRCLEPRYLALSR